MAIPANRGRTRGIGLGERFIALLALGAVLSACGLFRPDTQDRLRWGPLAVAPGQRDDQVRMDGTIQVAAGMGARPRDVGFYVAEHHLQEPRWEAADGLFYSRGARSFLPWRPDSTSADEDYRDRVEAVRQEGLGRLGGGILILLSLGWVAGGIGILTGVLH
jgi:hypothetical protein